MALFGVIAAGRMVQTDFTVVKEGEYIIELPNSDSINHIVVFLTGLQPLPIDIGASIFISWSTPGEMLNSTNWSYLGFISNEKPSAIFRVGQLNRSLKAESLFVPSPSGSGGLSSSILGVMLEPISQIQLKNDQITERNAALAEQQNSISEYAEKLLRNFVNFVQSFAVSLPKPAQMMGSTTMTEMSEYIPAKAVVDWFNNFQRRLQMNPNFWKTLP